MQGIIFFLFTLCSAIYFSSRLLPFSPAPPPLQKSPSRLASWKEIPIHSSLFYNAVKIVQFHTAAVYHVSLELHLADQQDEIMALELREPFPSVAQLFFTNGTLTTTWKNYYLWPNTSLFLVHLRRHPLRPDFKRHSVRVVGSCRVRAKSPAAFLANYKNHQRKSFLIK